MNYIVEFVLRSDCKNYIETDLTEWRSTIEQAINIFNRKESRHTDGGSIRLNDIDCKKISVYLSINDEFTPETQSFVTRVGSLSRFCKDNGMDVLLSPQGRLFTLKIVSSFEHSNDEERKSTAVEDNIGIYINYYNGTIMIPIELAKKYSIKFYDETEKEEYHEQTVITKSP